jgi:hypothetical protein
MQAKHAAYARRARCGKPAAAVLVDVLRRDFRGRNIGWAAYQHGKLTDPCHVALSGA